MSVKKNSKSQKKDLKMILRGTVILFTMLITYAVNGQDDQKVLFTVDGAEVYNAEFIRVFEKNKDIVVEDGRKDFDDYFDLFVDFKLKLKQAREKKLDTLSSYTSELIKYRDQLVQPYLQDSEATETLIKEAYDRTLEEVRASHILVRLEPTALPIDTLKAYHKIIEARNKIVEGASFDSIARQYSEDPSVKINNGDLGYFSAFSMVYSFENAAYNTAVGGICEPFRTQFGYHILKVTDKRKSPGEVQVAHIMVKNDSTATGAAKEKIYDIHSKLEQGDDFANIAKEHSDDLTSAQKGGVLPKFGTGRMIPTFEKVAFSLKLEGDFSQPFESDYGWHILKLLKKYPIASYEDLHEKLESKVKNGSRSSYVEKSLAKKIGANYKVVTYKAKLQLYSTTGGFKDNKDTLLTVEKKIFTGNDFYLFAESSTNRSKQDLYEEFTNKMIIDYYKEHLEESNTDFALTYQEYKDGLLLFELLQKEVWERSEKDTVGLLNYFNANRSKYQWNRRADLTIASCTQRGKAEEVRNMLISDVDTDSIKSLVNDGATIHVLFSKGRLEEGSSKLPETYQLAAGVSDIYEVDALNFTIIKVDKIYEPQMKELNETRGEVMNDYQNYLEEQWVKELHKMYQVKVNKKNYKELKNQYAGE